MLSQYSTKDRGIHKLDSALKDAVQMVRVSDERISYLRKMHAQLLLKRVKDALHTYQDDDEDGPMMMRDDGNSHAGGVEVYSDFSDSDPETEDMDREAADQYRATRKARRIMASSRRSPDSDEFGPVGKGGSVYSHHSQGGSMLGKESIFDEADGLLAKEEDDPNSVYTAQPFYLNGSRFSGHAFDIDLEKGDYESGSSGSGLEGRQDKDAPEPEGIERFKTRFKRRRKINWTGSAAFFLYIVAFIAYMYIRVSKTLVGLGQYLVYGIFVLVVEVLGATTTLIYGTNLIWDPVNEEDKALAEPPPLTGKGAVTESVQGDGETTEEEIPSSVKGGSDCVVDVAEVTGGQYNIRVLIPCYKEDADIVEKTIVAIRNAVLPPGCSRTIYVCDDGKDRLKRRCCQRIGRDCVYVSGRTRAKDEMNGKSGNLNNVCKQIYPEGCSIPFNEVICVMDADQVADPTFFVRMVPMLDGGDDVGMVLSPQCFWNLNQGGDIFNHTNIHFWEYMQPGYDALGFISCTGTNFLVRSKAFQECGWSPEYTLTEDYALGMELKMRNWQCRYVKDYLAVGEAPDQIRNCFQQRSRWCKGHFQVMFSKQHCPLLQRKLGFFMKILFCSGVWSYVVASLATPTFIIVPLLTIWFGIFPIVLSWWAALGLTIYYVATCCVLQYTRSRKHIFPLFFSNISTVLMFWTFVKAFWRSLIAKTRFGNITFKTTLKGFGRLQNSAIGDLWVPITVFVASAVSLGIGISKVVNSGQPKTTLLVSLLWMIFNMVPPFLLLWYWLIGRGTTLRFICKIAFVLTTVCGIGALVLIWLLYPKPFDYSGAIRNNFVFLQSMQVGTLPQNSLSVPWRSTAYAQDAKAPLVTPLTNILGTTHDSSGGWMTGGPGGNIKMTQPTAFTTMMLAWGVIAFPNGYLGSRPAAMNSIQVGIEYLKTTLLEFTPTNPKFYVIYQVGNISVESNYWGYPEANTDVRPAYYIPTTVGASDLTASMAAAFAASSIAFQSANKVYAQELLTTAVALYTSAKTYPGAYSSRIRANVCNSQYARNQIGATGALKVGLGQCKGPYDAYNGSAVAWYNSTSYYDDMSFAAAWLLKATRNPIFKNDAATFYIQHSQGPEGFTYDSQLLFNWNNVFWGTNILLAQLTNQAAFHQQAESFFKYWICGTGGNPVQYTPLGRSWNINDGSLGTTANAVFLATLYGSAIAPAKNAAQAKRYVCWARAQTRYVLGDSGPSYQVGFGKVYSTHAQVMGASCRGLPFAGKAQNCSIADLVKKASNPHVATGALLEMSSRTDAIPTSRPSNNSRVAPEYNAGFVGALAGLQTAPGDWNECLQGNGVISTDTVVCKAQL